MTFNEIVDGSALFPERGCAAAHDLGERMQPAPGVGSADCQVGPETGNPPRGTKYCNM